MRTRSIFITVFLLLSGLIKGQVADTLKFVSLQPGEFQKAYQNSSNALLIDVREFFEYRKSRIEKAVNIPSSGNLDLAADTLNKESSLFLYCTSGFRSKRVARSFYDKGFHKLYSLEGGITAWKKNRLPVSRKKIKK